MVLEFILSWRKISVISVFQHYNLQKKKKGGGIRQSLRILVYVLNCDIEVLTTLEGLVCTFIKYVYSQTS